MFLFTALIGLLSSCKDDTEPLPADSSENVQQKCFKVSTDVTMDGQDLGTTTYRYNAQDLIEVEIAMDAGQNISDSTHYTYNDQGKLVRRYSVNYANGFVQVQDISYDKDGYELENELVANGMILTHTVYFRRADHELDSVHLTTYGSLRRLYYSHADGKVSEIKEYDVRGQYLQKRVFEYAGNKTTIRVVDASGQETGRTELLADDKGREVEWRSYGPTGDMTISKFTEYDENGNIVRVENEYVGHGKYVYTTAWSCES